MVAPPSPGGTSSGGRFKNSRYASLSARGMGSARPGSVPDGSVNGWTCRRWNVAAPQAGRDGVSKVTDCRGGRPRCPQAWTGWAVGRTSAARACRWPGGEAAPLAVRVSVRSSRLDRDCPARTLGEPPMSRCTCSPLDSLETTFRLLSTGPQPLALDGHAIGLPRASIGLWELRPILFHPATGVAIQRAVLVELVGRARRRRGAWMIGLVGMLLPGLRHQVASVPEGRSERAATSGAMVLVSLLERLDDPEVSSERTAESLLWAVVRPPGEPASSTPRRPVLVAVAGGRR